MGWVAFGWISRNDSQYYIVEMACNEMIDFMAQLLALAWRSLDDLAVSRLRSLFMSDTATSNNAYVMRN